ncbi:MAG TPA: hypothetical protein VMN60_00445 [Longimicrobiales bacterium]|nr:hypothetical protein [Longimicrobiales bacterium]
MAERSLVTPLRRRVAPLCRALYVAPLRALVLLPLTACAAAPAARAPAAVDSVAEARIIAATAPQRRLHVLFDWTIRDPSVNMSGKGVLRLDRGERGRVDLFGPRGETLMAAIVENDQMRMVPAFASGMLPPPALMWSVLGVFRRPDLPLTRTVVDSDAVTLEYERDGTRWRFRFVDDVMRGTEWTSGTGRRTVALSGTAAFGVPRDIHFRDWTEFRELNMRVTDVEETQGFDADVWILPSDR